MSEELVKQIVIVGGGTAGWMSAAAFVHHLGSDNCSIRLVESEQIGTVGVGEATIPAIRLFNERLDLDEVEFMRATNATFKLGIQFENWRQLGDSYLHPFGSYGHPVNRIHFQHFWLRHRANGDVGRFWDYNTHYLAAERGKFSKGGGKRGKKSKPSPTPHYAFHFDATLYAQYLRGWSEARGVRRTEGKVTGVTRDPESGDIRSITLDSGEVIEGQLFIDCSGFRGLLIEQELATGFEDWSHWLPANRAWAVSVTYPEDETNIPPYTRARALDAGWTWRIPLQNRTGDGHVYSVDFQDEQAALDQFLDNIDGEAMFEPRLLKFTTGLRKNLWTRNCVAIGLSAGFLEPLESTSIALIQFTIMNLINLFPVRGIDATDRDEFNRIMRRKYEEARDFLIMHYHANERDDTDFWRYCRDMSIPEELERRMALFRLRGHVAFSPYELFVEHSWLSVLIGQGILPESWDPRVDSADAAQARQLLDRIRGDVDRTVQAMPTHSGTLASYCKGDLVTARGG